MVTAKSDASTMTRDVAAVLALLKGRDHRSVAECVQH